MHLVFVTNYINHHQVYIADEFYEILKGEYTFIATESLPDFRRELGYSDFSNRPYLLNVFNDDAYSRAKEIIYEADVVIHGSAPEEYVRDRIFAGKLTFRYSERWFKSKPWFLTGPRGWVNFYRNHIRHNDKPLYMLCASAYTAKDVNTIGAYKNKCFKWGYFTKVDNLEVEAQNQGASTSESPPHIMWCARFLRLKHPELPVKLAVQLKKKGYKFTINMFGSGEELENTRTLANKLDVEDVVNFCGNRPNDEILEEMRRHDIFLFTSDRNEGWGAVLNEAMSCGCAVVGSNEIGSVPFLIEDGVNGLIFKSENLNSLEEKVRYLLDNPIQRDELAKKAYATMHELWSPAHAAKQLMQLVDALQKVDSSLIPIKGPGSKV